MDVDNVKMLGLDRSLVDGALTQPINGRSFFEDVGTATSAPGDAGYEPCPVAFPGPDVERGHLDHVAGWHRPDLFGLVLSHCGSFTAIRGGNNFPYLVRSTERKPIKVFLQSGAADLDTLFGSWSLANQAMAAALAFAGYEFRFEFGAG